MKVIKPQRVGVVHRVFENGREPFLVVTTLLFVPLTEPRALLTEVNMWKAVARELGQGAVFDAGMPKPCGELLANGSAFTGDAARTACSVRVAVGALDKTIAVVGDRVWEKTGPSAPTPFKEMPLVWERAFGGEGYAQNPVGKGFRSVVVDGKTVHPLPNLEYPGALIRSTSDRPEPAGFGALDPSLPQRKSKTGTYDAAWLKERSPGVAADFDLRFFLAAPADQQVKEGYLQGDEIFVVENMHPTLRRLEGALPGFKTRVLVTQKSGATSAFKDLATRLDTVHLFPSIDRCALLFRSILRIAEDDAADIEHIVVACEHRAAPKKPEHYADLLARRLDRTKAQAEALREDDLLPSSQHCILDYVDKAASAPLPIAREGFQRENMLRGAEAARREAAAAREAIGMTAPVALAPSATLQASSRIVGPPAALVAPAGAHDERLKEQYRLSGHHQDAAKTRSEAESESARRSIEEARTRGASLAGVDFTGADLSGMDLRGTDLRGAMLESASLAGGKLDGANLGGAMLARADCTGASLQRANLFEANLAAANLTDARLDGSDLSRANLEKTKLLRTSLMGAKIGEMPVELYAVSTDFSKVVARRMTIVRGRFDACSFKESDWEKCVFVESDLRSANFDAARLERTTFLKSTLDGATFAGAFLHRMRAVQGTSIAGGVFRGANLTGANVRGANLEHADFDHAVLEGTDFSEANLTSASFHGAAAREARFIRTTCTRADFTEASLMFAMFRKAKLEGAVFARANLFRADLSLARGDQTTSFAGAHVSEALYVDRVRA